MGQEILVVLLLWLALQLPLGIFVGSCVRFGMTRSDRSLSVPPQLRSISSDGCGPARADPIYATSVILACKFESETEIELVRRREGR